MESFPQVHAALSLGIGHRKLTPQDVLWQCPAELLVRHGIGTFVLIVQQIKFRASKVCRVAQKYVHRSRTAVPVDGELGAAIHGVLSNEGPVEFKPRETKLCMQDGRQHSVADMGAERVENTIVSASRKVINVVLLLAFPVYTVNNGVPIIKSVGELDKVAAFIGFQQRQPEKLPVSSKARFERRDWVVVDDEASA